MSRNLISYPLQTIIIWFLPKPHITSVSLKLSFLCSTMTSKLPSSQMCLNPYFIWSHCGLYFLWLLSPFPLWLWSLLVILLLVCLSDHILSVTCWFAFLWLCLEDDVLQKLTQSLLWHILPHKNPTLIKKEIIITIICQRYTDYWPEEGITN